MSSGVRNFGQKIAHELWEFLAVFLFVAPFFISFATYRIYVGRELGNAYFDYGASFVNALIVSKIILLGEFAGVGKRFENQRLIIPTCYKAAAFTLLYLTFHATEGIIHALWHGQDLFGAVDTVVAARRGEFLRQGLTLFFAFIPFFALRETRRVLGPDQFRHLFFGGRPQTHPDGPPFKGQLEPSGSGDRARRTG